MEPTLWIKSEIDVWKSVNLLFQVSCLRLIFLPWIFLLTMHYNAYSRMPWQNNGDTHFYTRLRSLIPRVCLYSHERKIHLDTRSVLGHDRYCNNLVYHCYLILFTQRSTIWVQKTSKLQTRFSRNQLYAERGAIRLFVWPPTMCHPGIPLQFSV